MRSAISKARSPRISPFASSDEAALRPLRHLDLVALAAHLRRRQAHPGLVAAISRAAAIGSIRDDLRSAAKSLEIIRGIQERAEGRPEVLPGGDEETTIAGALFTNAIILYSRATFTSGSRPSLLGDDGLGPVDKATHAEVKALRNSAFAHFGLGEAAAGGPIVREAVVRSFDRRQYRYGVYTTRAQHKVDLGARLEALIGTRLGQVAARQQGLFDEVERMLNDAAISDTALGSLLPTFEFDPDRFCASPAAAAHLRAMLDDGDVADTSYSTSVPVPRRPR